jgi:plastocyanin
VLGADEVHATIEPRPLLLICRCCCVSGLAAVSLLGEAVHAEDATVRIDNFTFAPERLTVKAGTTVTWRNEDDIPHTVTSATRLFKSSALDRSTHPRRRATRLPTLVSHRYDTSLTRATNSHGDAELHLLRCMTTPNA